MPLPDSPGLWMMHGPALGALRARLRAAGPPGRPHAASPRRPEDADDFERRLFTPGKPATWMAGDVAVVEVRGMIFPNRAAALDEMHAFVFGGTMLDDLVRELGRLAADPAARGIMLSVDSPGGLADGNAEAAEAIRRLGKAKPIHAHTSGIMASAAYFLAAAAGRISAAPGSEVGSIGTVIVYLDDREMLDQMGLREIPFVSSISPDKWPDPTTPEGAALWQQRADESGQSFLAAVAKYRGVTEAKAKATFGRGWVLNPARAREAGMIDAVETLDQAIDALSSQAGGGKQSGGRRAASVGPPRAAGLNATLGPPAA